MVIAFVDESARERAEDECVYVLAAAVVDAGVIPEVREAMRALRVGKSPVVHWRLERPERRRLLVTALKALPLRGVAAVSIYSYGSRAERARRHCLDRLLRELQERGVTRSILESRGPALDHRDRQVLTGLRTAGTLSRGLKVSWERGSNEPLLWAADCLAGCVTGFFGERPAYLCALGDRVKLIEAP